MIDTVALLLEREDFIISKPKRFNPSAEGLIHTPYYPASNQGFMKCVNNPSKDEILKNGYLPRLTLFARNNRNGFRIQLKIEFSAPKILFGNNFDELEDRDFDQLIFELKDKLKIMGIVTIEDKLRYAKVSAMHYSKNIILDKYTRCSHILNELRKVNLNQKLDLNNTDYRNYGHVVKYHANSYEIVFYDKVKDFERSKISEKRSVEKDNRIQLDLFNILPYPNINNILRMEVRLSNKRALTNIFKKLDMDFELSFSCLFHKHISKEILTHYFQTIWDNWYIDMPSRTKPEDLFIDIEKTTQYEPNKIFGLIGTLIIIDSIGFQGLRNLLANKSVRTWQRIKSEIINLKLESLENLRIFDGVSTALNKYDSMNISGNKKITSKKNICPEST